MELEDRVYIVNGGTAKHEVLLVLSCHICILKFKAEIQHYRIARPASSSFDPIPRQKQQAQVAQILQYGR